MSPAAVTRGADTLSRSQSKRTDAAATPNVSRSTNTDEEVTGRGDEQGGHALPGAGGVRPEQGAEPRGGASKHSRHGYWAVPPSGPPAMRRQSYAGARR